jgi:pimeloyl-ACP methyl ester carboxylesterase
MWINFILPGLDGSDEKRGKNFKGTAKDHCELIVRLLDRLKIEKVILCCHSFGFWVYNAF